ncbi:MAG: glycosyltransferase family 1 protein [Gemmatimonadaceae bacterium]
MQRNGGISTYFAELANRMMRLRGESKLLMYGDNEASSSLPREVNRVETQPRPFERYRNVSIGGGGIFHSSYYRYSTGAGALNVITAYDFTYERFQRGVRKWVHSWQKFRAIRKADAVICISESTRNDLRAFLPDVPEEKVFVIPLAASDAFARLPADASDAAGNYVLFVGSRSGYKNFALLVKALGLVPGVMLYVVGGGAFTNGEVSLINRSIPGRHRYLGSVSVKQLNQLYANAVCLVYPSVYEGFGIPVLEAMQSGCPVVALANSSMREVAGGAARLLPDAEPVSLATAIEKCLDPAVREEMLAAGFARASRYSWERTFRETVSVYERLLGRQLLGACD